MNDLHEVIDGLIEGRWYNVYGSLDEANEDCPSWWAAWWDGSSQSFWTGTGDAIFMDYLKVIPEPLPEV